MVREISSVVTALCIAWSGALAPSAIAATTLVPMCSHTRGSQLLTRTELVFGLSFANGEEISEHAFQRFVDEHITPHFPDGLTIVNGDGRFKNASGQFIRERSKLIILLYPAAAHDSDKIETIRAEYRKQFAQQSVLRMDEVQCVAF